jgi:hypothetical protein
MLSKKVKTTFPVEQAWAAVCAADRVNNGEFINDRNIYSFQTAENEVNISLRTNKRLAYEFLENPDVLTEEDFNAGRDLMSHYQGLLFRALSTPKYANGFMDTVTKIVGMKEVGRYEVACMAALPKSYRREIAHNEKLERQQSLAPVSEYIGGLSDKVQINAEIVDRVYSKNYNIFIYTCISNNNVIKFSSAHGDRFVVGTTVSIKGAVKRLSENDRTGVKETWLTRVKLV